MTNTPWTKIKFAIASILFVALTSCAYQFEEDYFVDLAIPEPSATVTLNEIENGAILSGPTDISYNYDGKNKHELYGVAIFVDGVRINQNSSSGGSFTINTDNLSEGEHTLTIEYSFSSGSGSLADINNVEVYTTTEEFTFNVDKSEPEVVELTKVEVIDGSIFVSWKPIQNKNFTTATLLVRDPDNYRLLEEFTLDDTAIANSVYNDRRSTAFDLNYTLVLKNRYAESESNTLNLTLEEPSFGSEIIDETHYKIIWGEHPLYGNFDFYHYSVRPDFEIVEVSNRGGEYIVNDIPVFAQPHHHSLSLRRRDEFSSLFYVGGVPSFGKPFDKKYCNKYTYNVTNNTFYVLEIEKGTANNASKDVMIHKLDGNDLSLIQTRIIVTTINAIPNIIIDPVTGNIIVDMLNESHLLDANSLTEVNSWEASNYANDGLNYITSYRNDIVILESIGDVFFYDEQSKVLLHQITGANQHFKFSDDGRFFYHQEAIYEFINGTATQLTTTYEEKPVFGIEFLSDQNKIAYFEFHQNPVIYDVTADTKTTLFQLADVRAINLDPKTGKLMFYNKFYEQIQNQFNVSTLVTAYVHAVDPSSNQIKSLRVFEDFYADNFKYLNGKVILTSGLYLDDYLN